ncbi:MAG TPA: uracil-DNA glycosylase [Armatimonadetes bacterium]|nr:uracil-DNA glycosylase [Armatimonadota bacterium]
MPWRKQRTILGLWSNDLEPEAAQPSATACRQHVLDLRATNAAFDLDAELATLQTANLACRECRLAELRTQVVVGQGSPRSPMVLVGQSPGEREDRSGSPFVGPAGQLLNECLAACRIRRDQIWVTNLVKCRPYEVGASSRGLNRDLLPDEVEACAPWLEAELALLAPRVIVCIGGPSAKLVLDRQVAVTRARGQWFTNHRFAPAHVLVVLHPAYILRHHGPDFERLRAELTDDLETARKMAARLRREAREAAQARPNPPDEEPRAQQRSLFD